MATRGAGLEGSGSLGPRPWYERIHEGEAPPRPAVVRVEGERSRHEASREPTPAGRRSAWRILSALIALAGIGAGYLAGTRLDGFNSLVARLDGAEFTATPHFSLERFRAVQPGMTEKELRNLIGNPVERYGGMGGAVAWRYTLPARPGPAPYRFCSVIVDKNTGRVVNTVERGWKEYNIWQDGYAFLSARVGTVRLKKPGRAPLVLSEDDPTPHVLIVSSATTIRGRGGADVLAKQREYNDAGLQAHVVATEESSGLAGAYTGCSRNLKPWIEYYGNGQPYQVLVYERGVLYYAGAAASHLYPGLSNGDEAWLVVRLRAAGAGARRNSEGLRAAAGRVSS